MNPDILPRLFQECQEVVTEAFSPGELSSQYGDSEQEEDHASRSREGANQPSCYDQKDTENERQDPTRTVRKTFPGHFHALHTSSITRVVT